jgi:hypothetical protein
MIMKNTAVKDIYLKTSSEARIDLRISSGRKLCWSIDTEIVHVNLRIRSSITAR